MTLIAQISDLHIRQQGELIEGKINTFEFLTACIDRINALPLLPDLVIASGDLADSGKPAEYLRLKTLLDQLSMPYFVLPGNHDSRAGLREVFGGTPALPVASTGPLQYAIELPGLRILCLDTLDEGKEGGCLCMDRLDWLHDQLTASPLPTMLFLHHPPFDCGIPGMDAIKLGNPDALADVLSGHLHVIGLACGHVHRSVFTTWAGIPACICPSPAHQIHLNMRPDDPLAWTLEPGGLLLHQAIGGLLTSHVIQGPIPLVTKYD